MSPSEWIMQLVKVAIMLAVGWYALREIHMIRLAVYGV